MHFLNEEILVKIKSLPIDTREKVINGLIQMLAERPKALEKELKNENILTQTELEN
jgi:hypothetical protein